MATWTEIGQVKDTDREITILPSSFIICNNENNVAGIIVAKGGNGTTAKEREKREYYWHL